MWVSGRTAVWSFKPSPPDVANGAWKPFVQALGKYIVENGVQDRTVIVIWHEAENYFKTAEQFVFMFNTVHDWLMSVDPSIVTSHAALAYAYRDRGTITDKTAKQWVTRATIHSIDIYSGRSFPLEMTLGTSTGFKRWKASRPAGAPWGVSERGWIATAARSAERVASIEAEADWLAALPVEDQPAFYCVWNTEGVENDPTIILDQPAKDAVNRMFARLNALRPTIVCPLCTGAGRVVPGTYPPLIKWAGP